jgi:hypothetical protein
MRTQNRHRGGLDLHCSWFAYACAVLAWEHSKPDRSINFKLVQKKATVKSEAELLERIMKDGQKQSLTISQGHIGIQGWL